MSAAQIVGDVERKKGYKEKPILYTTVISPKETSVTHTGVDPSYASMSLEARSKALRSKANKTEIGKLADGKYSVPVRLGNSKRLADPTKTEYDSPVFVEKKQYIGPPLASASLNPITQHFMNIAMGDSSVIKTNLQGANDPEAKFRNLLFARKQIKRDSMALIEKLREQIKRIEDTSLVNARLDRLLDRYSEEDKKKDRLDDLLKDLDSKLSSN